MKKVFYLLLFLLISCNMVINSQKQFELYDAMAFPGKPALTSEGLLPVYLIYEGSLTKENPDRPNRVILDMDKVNAMAELTANFPHVMVSTDIEDWLGDSSIDEYELFYRFKTMFDVFRVKNPDVVIGNYGVATSSLCVYRYYNQDKYDDGVIIQNWRNNNSRRWKSLETVDVITPVAYIAEPNITSWIRDLELTVQEIRKHDANKKIIVYIWPQYYDKPDSPYNRQVIDPVTWRQMLDAVYEKCDGAILWSSTRDKDGNYVRWYSPEIQNLWNATREFIAANKSNMRQPEPEQDLIVNNNPDKIFKLFASLSYSGTPNLSLEGIHSIRFVDEQSISSGLNEDGIYAPDYQKIESLAQNLENATSDMPVLITRGTWIRDRNANHSAMTARYQTVKNVFRSNNTKNPLGYVLVAPSGLTGLRTTGSNFYTNSASWLISAATPIRALREYADYLMPASHTVDDDTTLWKREFYLTIKEARRDNPNKPVYAHIHTDYFNVKENFADYYKPIKEETFTVMLEAAYKLCDGVVMSNVGNTPWNENSGFWRATKKFINKYKDKIELPVTGGPIVPVEGNLIQNGSFEEDFIPSRKPGQAIYTLTDIYAEPARIAGFFDAETQPYWPKMDDVTTPVFNTANGIWYHRHSDIYSHVRLYVDTYKVAPDGDKCLTFHNVGSTNTARVWQASTPFQHAAAQRVILDNAKKYLLSFSYRRADLLQGPGVSKTSNDATRFVAVIASSTDPSDYTYVVDIPVPAEGDEVWKNMEITLDLPALITENAMLDFTSSTIIFGLQTKLNDSGHMLPGQMSIDNIVLKENLYSSVVQHLAAVGYRLYNKTLIINDAVQSVQVFDIAGGLLYQNSLVPAGQPIYMFDASGVYLVKLNDNTSKVVVR